MVAIGVGVAGRLHGVDLGGGGAFAQAGAIGRPVDAVGGLDVEGAAGGQEQLGRAVDGGLGQEQVGRGALNVSQREVGDGAVGHRHALEGIGRGVRPEEGAGIVRRVVGGVDILQRRQDGVGVLLGLRRILAAAVEERAGDVSAADGLLTGIGLGGLGVGDLDGLALHHRVDGAAGEEILEGVHGEKLGGGVGLEEAGAAVAGDEDVVALLQEVGLGEGLAHAAGDFGGGAGAVRRLRRGRQTGRQPWPGRRRRASRRPSGRHR